MYSFSEFVHDEQLSLIQSIFTKEITVQLEKKFKVLIPTVIYLCSVLASGVEQGHYCWNLWMWNNLMSEEGYVYACEYHS